MSNRRRWWGWLARWRHSHGYGVHSPFAYDMIVNTLRGRDPYYAYQHIDAQAGGHRLILRVACRLKPRVVSASGHDSRQVMSVMRMYDSRVTFSTSLPLDMAILTPGACRDDYVRAVEVLRAGGCVILLDSRSDTDGLRLIAESMPASGLMTFSNGRVYIAVGRADLPRQHFELYF